MPGSVQAGDGSERHARWVTYGLAGWFAIAMGMAIPLAFQHLEATFEAGPGIVGLASAAFGAAQVLVRLPVGRWIDARGEHGVLTASWISTVAAGVGFLLAASLSMAILSFLLFGVAVGLFWVGAHTLASRLAPGGELARSMTRFQIVVGVGFMLGPPLGGAADALGYSTALGSLTIFGAIGLVGHRVLPHPDAITTPNITRAVGGGTLWLGVLAAFFLGILLGTSDTFVPVRLVSAGSTALGVGLFLAAREASNLLARLSTSRLVDDDNASLFLAVGALAGGAGLILFGRTLSVPGLGLSAVGQGVGIGLVAPASLTLAARGSLRGELGRAMGRHGTALGVGLLVGPLVLGPIGGAYSLVRLFDVAGVVAGIVSLVAAAAWVRTRARS